MLNIVLETSKNILFFLKKPVLLNSTGRHGVGSYGPKFFALSWACPINGRLLLVTAAHKGKSDSGFSLREPA